MNYNIFESLRSKQRYKFSNISRLNVLVGLVVAYNIGLMATHYIGSVQTNAPPSLLGVARQQSDGNVLAVSDSKDKVFGVNIPVIMRKNVQTGGDLEVRGVASIEGTLTVNGGVIDAGSGRVLASNILYSLTAGEGIDISGGQTPVIRSVSNGVTSIQGKTGGLSFEAGEGITIEGLKIVNKNPSQTITDTFKTFTVVGQGDIVASGNADKIIFEAGTGMSLSRDATNKKITFNSSAQNSGWTKGSGIVYLTSGTDNVGIGTTAPGASLAIGAGATSPFMINSSGNITRINGVQYSFPSNQADTTMFLRNNGSGQLTWGTIAGTDGASVKTYVSNYIPLFSTITNQLITSSIFQENGNIGIGTTNPTSLFSIGTGATSPFTIDASGNITRINNIAYSFPFTQGASNSILLNNGSGNLTWSTTIPNSTLQNSSIGIITGAGMSGGGTVALGSSITLTNAGVTSIIGTLGEIDVNASSGSVILSLPATINRNISGSAGYASISPCSGITGNDLGCSDIYVNTAGDTMTGQLISSVLTGASPFSVASTTLNSNLNADLLDGQHGSYYAPLTNMNGSAGYLSKFTGTSSVGNSVVYETGGNVGIGTTAPEFKLSLDNDGGIIAKGTYGSGASLATSGAGARMIWYPKKAAFRAGYTNGTQWNDDNIGNSSIAMGSDITASGTYSTAMGYLTNARGDASTAMGQHSIASGMYSISMGTLTTASGTASTAMGAYTVASGIISTAMGYSTTANGAYSTAMGWSTNASSNFSTAMGQGTTASGGSSTSMGAGTTASGNASTSMGAGTTASGTTSTAMGGGTTANSNNSTAIGSAIIVGTTSSDAQYSIGIGLDSTARTITSPNTLAIMGGNVGIGIVSPLATLDVNGTAWLRGTGSSGLFVNSSGNVGIGTTAPEFKLSLDNDGGIIAKGTYGSGASLATSGAGARMIWYPKKAAFRAGYVAGTNWDDGNIGVYSTATGLSPTASGDNSTAFGNQTRATGNSSVAMGYLSNASGDYSTAMGQGAYANGWSSTAIGLMLTARSSYTTAIGSAIIVGTTSSDAQYSIGIGLDSTARTITSPNTLAIMGGNVGIGSLSPSSLFSVGTGDTSPFTIDATGNITRIKSIGYSFPSSQGNSSTYLMNDGSGNLTWSAISGTGTVNTGLAGYFSYYPTSGTAVDDQTILYTNGTNIGIGTTAPEFKLSLDNDGGIIAKGTYGSGASLATSGAGARMIWYPKKAAFRVGYVDGAQWDDVNIGIYSTAMGDTTTASGQYSTAMGGLTIASGPYSTAMGYGTTASGTSSTAMGDATTASGTSSTAMGQSTTASGLYSTAMGDTTTASGPYSTAMGRQTTASGPYSTAMGSFTNASGIHSTAMGVSTTASGVASTAMGYGMTVDGNFSMGIGLDNTSRTVTSPNTLAIMGGNVGIGTTAPEFKLSLDNDGGIIAKGTYGSGATLTTSGAGTRMIWYPKKSAFRAGYVDGAQWDDVNIGSSSTATGLSPTASGDNSTAFGNQTRATGNSSVAMGYLSNASGDYSTAMGQGAYANGWSSTAIGLMLTARSSYTTAIGSAIIVGTTSSDAQYSIGIGLDSTARTITSPNTLSIMGGNVGIGIDGTNGYRLRIGGGSAAVDTGQSWTTYSDIRLKKNIETYESVLPSILNLRTIRYNGLNEVDGKGMHVGFIAQEIKPYFPEVVITDSTDGYMGLDYGRLSSIAIKGIQEQQKEIQDMGIKLDTSGNINASQSAQLDTLQTKIDTTLDPTLLDLGKMKDTIATLSAELDAIQNTTTITNIASIEADLANLKSKTTEIDARVSNLETQLTILESKTSATISAVLGIDQVATLSALTVTGKTTLNDIGVTGYISNGQIMVDGINAQINTLTEPLSLQASSLAPVKIMGEKIVIDTKGNMKIKGDIFLEEGKIYGNATFRGKAILKKGDTEVNVVQTWTTIPESVILSQGFNAGVWYENVTSGGFTIKISTPQDVDTEISWIVIW